ncbi:NERD domain-containing protein [Nonomuraea phyllanthi]|uniref:NERD domain-containing protein n=1 Tax=Nonomuraea phyllanthi TaxID=2219224 RepID=A0A5C4WFD1_9ACTN|nr:nuclease-related domain-containing protein [Nonomuraea phyllanthi]KAB8193515.1 NERD domain-containing protein [Nonomuraea phyllanthi]QFY12257.1 NERD domain-containing protein [Nonomuraea phyllanthi]
MPGGSIYVQPNEKYTGSSPQWWYEKFWREDAPNRRRMRYVKAGVGFVIGVALALRFGLTTASPFCGLLLGGIVAGVDWYLDWRSFHATAVWRGARRGEAITGRMLRKSLGRLGYHVLDGRAIRGQASIDHLVIGPGGVWIIDNESWSPDTEVACYGGRLFFGEKYGSKTAKALVETAEKFAELLSRETRVPVTIAPMLAVHCGLLPKGGIVVAEGVTLLKPRLAAKVIRAAEDVVLSDEQIELIARTAARELQRT